MAKSDLLRFQDVRDAYRLIGECRDLGSDSEPVKESATGRFAQAAERLHQ